MFSATDFTAALPSVAVADNETVALLYDQYDGTNFQVHLAVSRDEGASIAVDSELYRFNTNGMVTGYGTTSSHDRLLGDYARMLNVGNTFYASFAGRGNTVSGTVTTTNLIVPFFFAYDASVVRPDIVTIAQPSTGSVRVDFVGTPGATYFIQANTNLASTASWKTVSTNIAPSTGLWSYADSTAGAPQRYYRAFTR